MVNTSSCGYVGARERGDWISDRLIEGREYCSKRNNGLVSSFKFCSTDTREAIVKKHATQIVTKCSIVLVQGVANDAAIHEVVFGSKANPVVKLRAATR